LDGGKKDAVGLNIRAKTWNRDSHGLFDYENNSVKSNNYIVDKSGFIIRKKNEVKYYVNGDGNFLGTDDRELFKVKVDNQRYFLHNKIETNLNINNENLTDLQEKIWHVIVSKPHNNTTNNVNMNVGFVSKFHYCLKKNDIIKLGRIKFLVREINIIGGNAEKTQEIFKNYKECSPIENLESNVCRICLMFTNDDQNPMISICKCKGSNGLIHLNCLNIWLKHKLTIREMSKKAGITYTVKAYNCEICKEPYPISIKYGETSHNLLTYAVPEGQNFVILESLNSIKENQYPLSVHILLFTDNEYYILGRGHDSDVRISDISVSRVHSKIYFQENKLYLEDCGSKFGTLVLAKDEVEMTVDNKILQIGRTLISSCLGAISPMKEIKNENKVTNSDSKQNIEFENNLINFDLKPENNDFDKDDFI